MLVVELVLDVADEKGSLAHTSFPQQNYFEVVLSQCTITGHCGNRKIILSSRTGTVIKVAVNNNVKPQTEVTGNLYQPISASAHAPIRKT